MRIVGALTLATAFALTSSAARVRAGQDGSIDLFPYGIDTSTGNPTTPDFGACQATVTTLPGGFLRLSFGVYARLSGATLAGIAVATCYLQGLETNAPGQLPAGWVKSFEYPVDAVSVGSISGPNTANPQTIRRWDVAWPVSGPNDAHCQRDPLVLLAIVNLFAFTPTANFPNNHYVSVVDASPFPPLDGCPSVGLYDTPVYTVFFVTC